MRTRSRSRLPGFKPGSASVPTFSLALDSLSVLPVAAGSRGLAVCPAGGSLAERPCSASLLLLNGMAAARASVALNFETALSALSLDSGPRPAFRDGPLTVERALDFRDFDFGIGNPFFGGRRVRRKDRA